MTGQQLKNSILQMAVSGKLVPQDPDDEPASVLLERIRTEKEQLVKEGRIKKEKNTSRIFRGSDNLPYEQIGNKEPVCIADEVPFEIPESWEWCRLGNIFNIKSAMRIHQTDWKSSGIPFFRGRELVQLIKTGTVQPEIYLSRELYEQNKSKGGVPQKDDLLITAVGTIGMSYIVQGTHEFYYKDAYILCLENIGHVLLPTYIKLVLDSPFSQNDIHRDSMATTVAQLTIMKAKSLLIPLPPFSEQRRIVAKYGELLPFIEEYTVKEQQTQRLNKIFPDQLRKSILQYAVQGKLVPQNPDDESASVLLDSIRAEKERLIAAGKIKRDKHESVIYRRDHSHYEKVDGACRCIDDEIPFEIPESWEWCRLGSISSYAEKKQKINAREADPSIWGLDLEDIEKGGRLLCKVPVGERKSVGDKTVFSAGDVLYSKLRPYLLKILVAPDDGICTSEIVPFHLYGGISAAYVVAFLKSPYVDAMINSVTYGVKMPRVGTETMTSLLVPLPPIKEQLRIVEKYQELLPFINEYTAKEQQTQELNETFPDRLRKSILQSF